MQNRATASNIKDQIVRIDETMKSDEMGNWKTNIEDVNDAKKCFYLFVQIDFEITEHYRRRAESMRNQQNTMNENYAAIVYYYTKLRKEVLEVCTKFKTLSI